MPSDQKMRSTHIGSSKRFSFKMGVRNSVKNLGQEHSNRYTECKLFISKLYIDGTMRRTYIQKQF